MAGKSLSASSSLDVGNQRAVEATIDDWLQLIRSEYIEIPGLHLTRVQVQRLWGFDTVTCDALLDALIDVRFLRRTPAGAFVRADAGSL